MTCRTGPHLVAPACWCWWGWGWGRGCRRPERDGDIPTTSSVSPSGRPMDPSRTPRTSTRLPTRPCPTSSSPSSGRAGPSPSPTQPDRRSSLPTSSGGSGWVRTTSRRRRSDSSTRDWRTGSPIWGPTGASRERAPRARRDTRSGRAGREALFRDRDHGAAQRHPHLPHRELVASRLSGQLDPAACEQREHGRRG